MKRHLLLIAAGLLAVGCVQNQQPTVVATYANDEEKQIIDKMDCWDSEKGQRAFDLYLSIREDKEKNEKQRAALLKLKAEYQQEWHQCLDEANAEGRTSLRNDTACIDIIRNDSLYQALLTQRKNLTDSLPEYAKKIAFFKTYLNKIQNNIVEYNYCYDSFFKDDVASWGIEVYNGASIFYKNYSELLKAKYSLLENADIPMQDIVALNRLLMSIEKLDRKLWPVKYYREVQAKIEENALKSRREQQIDSLFKATSAN